MIKNYIIKRSLYLSTTFLIIVHHFLPSDPPASTKWFTGVCMSRETFCQYFGDEGTRSPQIAPSGQCKSEAVSASPGTNSPDILWRDYLISRRGKISRNIGCLLRRPRENSSLQKWRSFIQMGEASFLPLDWHGPTRAGWICHRGRGREPTVSCRGSRTCDSWEGSLLSTRHLDWSDKG